MRVRDQNDLSANVNSASSGDSHPGVMHSDCSFSVDKISDSITVLSLHASIASCNLTGTPRNLTTTMPLSHMNQVRVTA